VLYTQRVAGSESDLRNPSPSLRESIVKELPMCGVLQKKQRFLAASQTMLVGFFIATVIGCGVIKEKPEGEPSALAIAQKPIPPDAAREILGEVGSNFAYGPGIGDTAVNIGAAVVFPPYAAVLLGNAILSLSGYEPVTVASILPEEDGKKWSETYDEVVSGPGRAVAAVAGREYRSREVGEQRMRELLKEVEAEQQKQDLSHKQSSK
jgi:hypothetical protein